MDCGFPSPPNSLLPAPPLSPLGTLSTAAYGGPARSGWTAAITEGNAKMEPLLHSLLSFFSPLKLKEQKAWQSNVQPSHPHKYCPGQEVEDCSNTSHLGESLLNHRRAIRGSSLRRHRVKRLVMVVCTHHPSTWRVRGNGGSQAQCQPGLYTYLEPAPCLQTTMG